ncbi:MAG: threonine synthase [Actinobacteria bacterium]|nr:threonine synthase [Thermoleophilia bacterium]MCB9010896.1 threonine synthase [Actinomycetota bacterium]
MTAPNVPTRYVSTRGGAPAVSFSDILLEGLAPDGGLYMPSTYPHLSPETLESWRGLSYAELATAVLGLFIDDIPHEDIAALCASAYTSDAFGSAVIVPFTDLGDGIVIEHLSNGPTLAFKDMAMQLLGALFEYELDRRGTTLNILGATSGDTGSAAEYAMRGREGITVFMLSPAGRMSDFQQAQMFSLLDPNIHNLSVDGVFDDCQDIVKAVSGDLDFKRRMRIGTVNSINWARLLAQVVYYVHGWLALTERPGQFVSFTVPSGNFGNICAGHVARMMGLPIHRLVTATNENDVLDEFFRTGTYRVRGSSETYETSSPSMDISKASNFERFIFDVVQRDGARVRELFETELGSRNGFSLAPDERRRVRTFGFASGRSGHGDRLTTIRETWERFGVLIDTHTADGMFVARDHLEEGVPMIVLETAQPVKFADVVEQATGTRPEPPAAVADLQGLPRRTVPMPADAEIIKGYITQRASVG